MAARLVWRDESTSTNAELMARAVEDESAWPDFSVLATDHQTAGRGRRDRTWEADPGGSLAISVLLRPSVAPDRLGWLPLIAGLAMTRSVRSCLASAGVDPSRAQLKWPNDVLVGERKICGVLSELAVAPGGGVVVVVGAGVNTSMTEAQLPVDTATSLAVEGVVSPDADVVLSVYLTELRSLYTRFTAADGDAAAGGIRRVVSDACLTLSTRVRVERPGGEVLSGVATALDADGHLVVRDDAAAGSEVSVAAGDVVHVRR
ncbi:biotin--[acetyl-CoA-carboxylase] ligase [Okibacterium endophyticum]